MKKSTRHRHRNIETTPANVRPNLSLGLRETRTGSTEGQQQDGGRQEYPSSMEAVGLGSWPQLSHQFDRRRRRTFPLQKLLAPRENIFCDLLSSMFREPMPQNFQKRFLLIERQLLSLVEDTPKRGVL